MSASHDEQWKIKSIIGKHSLSTEQSQKFRHLVCFYSRTLFPSADLVPKYERDIKMGMLANLMLGASKYLSKEQFDDLVDKVYEIDECRLAEDIDCFFSRFEARDEKLTLFNYVIQYLDPIEYRRLMGRDLLPWTNGSLPRLIDRIVEQHRLRLDQHTQTHFRQLFVGGDRPTQFSVPGIKRIPRALARRRDLLALVQE